MLRFGKISRTIKSYLVQVLGIGGTTENRFISPKGLYSKPKNENAIVFNLASGTNQDVVIALQKDVELEDDDVYLTDDNNYIHFKFKQGTIEIQGDTTFNDNVIVNKNLLVKGTITSNAGVIAPVVEGLEKVISNGLDFNDHGHPQDNDSSGDTQQDTDTPINVV